MTGAAMGFAAWLVLSGPAALLIARLIQHPAEPPDELDGIDLAGLPLIADTARLPRPPQLRTPAGT